MRASWLAVIITFSSFKLAIGQVAIGTNPSSPPSPDASAVLLLQGNGSQGLIVPIVTTLGTFGKQGMVVFNSTTNTMHYHNGSAWVTVGTGGGSNLIQISGNTITLGVGASSVNLATGFSNSARGFLYWNGTNWVQAQFTLPSTTQALVYDPATSTFGFQPLAAGGGISTLSTSGTYLSVTNPTGPTATITANPITNSDISNTAAIAGSKINPNFGAQNISTTGTISTGGLTIGTSTWPANAAGVLTNNGTGTLTWAAAPNPTLGGDLSGTAAAASVIRLQGQSVSATTPSAGQVLQYVSGIWTPANLTGGGTVTNVTATAPISVANGTTTPALTLNPLVDADISASAAIAGSKINPAFGAQNISGANLSATSTTLNGINYTWPNTLPVSNRILQSDPSGNLTWVVGGSSYSAGTGLSLTGNTFSVNPSQNISTLSNLTTNGLIRTTGGTGALSIATPGTDYLTPSGNAATATALATGRTISLTGDVTYTSPTFDGTTNVTAASTVARLQGRNLVSTAPTNGQVIKWNAGLNQWEPAADDVGGGATPTLNNGQILIGNGTTNSAAALSGDASLSAGVVTLNNSATTRTNLGLGTLATLSTITSAEITDGQVAGVDLASNIAINTTGNITAANVVGNGAGLTNLNAGNIASGTLAVANGGTGVNTAPANGRLLIGNGTGFTLAPLTAGAGVSIINAAGSITISSVSAPLSLDGLTDVTVTSPSAGQMLIYNGTSDFQNQSLSGDISAVSSTGAVTIANNAITDAKVATGINGSKIAPNFGAQNVVTTGTLTTGTAGAFAVDATGNVTKIRNVTTSFPAANAAGVLTNDGTGTLTWAAGSGWGLTGNAGTNPATNFIGTTDAQPLRFATGVGGTERMRLDATGNLGFGLTAPLSKFHIKQSAQVNDVLTDAGSGFFGAGLMFENSGTTDSYYVGYGNGGYFRIGSKSAANVFTGMVYASPTGVGIFSPVPTEKLDVTGNIKFSGALMPNNLPGTAGQVLTSAGPGLPPTWSGGSGWALGGNTGTVDGAPGTGTNYIGTRDNIPLNFLVNNVRAGRIEAAPASANSFLGYQAGNVNTGTFNAAFGYWAMTVNTTGQGNAAVGYRALANNTTGNSNSAMGFSSLSTNTTGSTNTAVGSEALRTVASGSDNTAVGQQALRNATGNANVGIGSQAAVTLTTGNDNAALGSGALFSTTTGSTNTAVGNASLSNNITGSANTALGYNAEVATGALTNATAIGANSSVTTSNTIQLGDAAVTTVNVGTGTTAKLVAGQLQITGGTLGTGRVLTSDASGNATWQPATGGGWGLTGNATTVDGTNFIGTTDNIPLTIRVNNQRAGRIESATPFATFYGYQAGLNNGAAQNNTAIGYQALSVATSASNTAVGFQAMQNSNGGQNTAVGDRALQANTNGNANTAIGQFALSNATSTSNNSAVGTGALQQTSGTSNIAIGTFAGTFNSTGATNVFVGYQAGYPNATVSQANTTGSNNTFVGANTGLANSTQRTNATAIGANAIVNADNTIQLGDLNVTTVNVGTGTTAKLVAGQLQITGGTLAAGRVLTSDAAGNATWQPASGGSLINSTGTNNLFAGTSVSTAGTDNAIYGYRAGTANTGLYNVFMGSFAAETKTTGDLNTIIGWFAGRTANNAGNTMVGAQSGENTTGGSNTFLGEKSGRLNTSGGVNTFIGQQTGLGNTTGFFNTAIGAFANMGGASLQNATAVGYQAQVSQSNSLVLGSINGVNGAGATVNVGIGTALPASRLHINEPSTAGNFLRITNNPSPNGLTVGLSGAGSQEAFISNNENAAMYFQTNATNRIAITAGGNVGIGTIAPNANLQLANNLGNRRLVLWESANNDHQFYGFGVNGGEFRYQIPNNAGAEHRFYAATSATTSLLQMIIGPNGNVAIAGSLSKGSGTFKIDHPQDPENKYLYHSFVESPDMMNVYNGNIITDQEGNATVDLPAYFESLNKDFRYQLTVIGAFAQAIVASEVNGNKFVIKTDKPNVKVSWQVTGIRKDPYAEQNRVVPEVEKPAKEKGKYLHPEAYGLPLDRSINHVSDKKENN